MTRLSGYLLAAFAASVPAQAQTVLATYTDLLGGDDGEITPDGRYAVLRDNTVSFSLPYMWVYDTATGAVAAQYFTQVPGDSSVVQDGIAVTNERAVAIGMSCMIADLTNLSAPLLLDADVGLHPRDLEITPDGTMVAIRGGSGVNGGLFVFDLATASLLTQAPGQPRPWVFGQADFDVDSVGATNEHAVFLSDVASTDTRVTIMDLHPSGGGAPAVVFETGAGTDLWGEPHDVAITPDGQYAVVRAELSIGLYRLDGANSGRVWAKRLWGNPGPMGGASMDSVEVTNDRIATISRYSVGGNFGAQVDVFDIAGNQYFEVIDGDPHDLAITPNGERLLVRTHTAVFMYDLANLPSGNQLGYMSRKAVSSTHTSYGAGLDSVITTDERAVILARNNENGKIRFFDVAGDDLVQLYNHQMPERPVDLCFTPSKDKVVMTGWSRVMIFDMRDFTLLLDHDVSSAGGYPWSDGVVANDQTAFAFGYITNTNPTAGGWSCMIDLFDQPQLYCTSQPNSTGAVAGIDATGSASVSSNNLRLLATDLPVGQPSAFLYGDGQVNTPFGNGTLCVGGQSSFFPIQLTGDDGLAELLLDNTNLPGAAISAGSTWNFQFVYRDRAAGGGMSNTTGGLEVQFGN